MQIILIPIQLTGDGKIPFKNKTSVIVANIISTDCVASTPANFVISSFTKSVAQKKSTVASSDTTKATIKT